MLCHLPEHCSSRHFHCSSCSKIIVRKENLKHHVQTCIGSINRTAGSRLVSTFSTEAKHTHENRRKLAKVPQESDNGISENDHCYATQPMNQKNNLSKSLNSLEPTKKSALRAACTVCGKVVTTKWLKSHLKTHQSAQHDINIYNHHHTVVIDPAKAVYCSSQSRSGPQIPIHLQKNTLTNAPIGTIYLCRCLNTAD